MKTHINQLEIRYRLFRLSVCLSKTDKLNQIGFITNFYIKYDSPVSCYLFNNDISYMVNCQIPSLVIVNQYRHQVDSWVINTRCGNKI